MLTSDEKSRATINQILRLPVSADVDAQAVTYRNFIYHNAQQPTPLGVDVNQDFYFRGMAYAQVLSGESIAMICSINIPSTLTLLDVIERFHPDWIAGIVLLLLTETARIDDLKICRIINAALIKRGEKVLSMLQFRRRKDYAVSFLELLDHRQLMFELDQAHNNEAIDPGFTFPLLYRPIEDQHTYYSGELQPRDPEPMNYCIPTGSEVEKTLMIWRNMHVSPNNIVSLIAAIHLSTPPSSPSPVPATTRQIMNHPEPEDDIDWGDDDDDKVMIDNHPATRSPPQQSTSHPRPYYQSPERIVDPLDIADDWEDPRPRLERYLSDANRRGLNLYNANQGSDDDQEDNGDDDGDGDDDDHDHDESDGDDDGDVEDVNEDDDEDEDDAGHEGEEEEEDAFGYEDDGYDGYDRYYENNDEENDGNKTPFEYATDESVDSSEPVNLDNHSLNDPEVLDRFVQINASPFNFNNTREVPYYTIEMPCRPHIRPTVPEVNCPPLQLNTPTTTTTPSNQQPLSLLVNPYTDPTLRECNWLANLTVPQQMASISPMGPVSPNSGSPDPHSPITPARILQEDYARSEAFLENEINHNLPFICYENEYTIVPAPQALMVTEDENNDYEGHLDAVEWAIDDISRSDLQNQAESTDINDFFDDII